MQLFHPRWPPHELALWLNTNLLARKGCLPSRTVQQDVLTSCLFHCKEHGRVTGYCDRACTHSTHRILGGRLQRILQDLPHHVPCRTNCSRYGTLDLINRAKLNDSDLDRPALHHANDSFRRIYREHVNHTRLALLGPVDLPYQIW